ncbi:MAG: GDSL-type esterase/lipase family protein [Bacteroidota bacterium]
MKSLLLICCLLFCQIATAQLADTPGFIKIQSNYIEFQDTTEFRKLIDGLKNAAVNGFRVAHFGDSHVQPDYSAGEIRKSLQAIGGVGGRGMTFPYSIAKTYSQHDYSSSFTGVWETSNSMHNPPRIPLGVSGFVARTSEYNSSFKMKFNKRMNDGAKIIKLVCDHVGFEISLTVDGMEVEESKGRSDNGFLFFETTNTFDSLQVKITKRDSASVFRLYGIIFEEVNPGVVYHNLGVGGARFDAIIQQKLYNEQIKILNPDLFILDWGTNDILAGDMVSSSLKNNIHTTIDLIRKQFPNAAILLTTVQDMNRKGKNIKSSRTFSKLIREIAIEKQCLLYDWFQVSGGGYSMKKWIAEKYAQNDNIHLTIKGYRLKGRLLGQAIINSLDTTSKTKMLNPLWILQQEIAVVAENEPPIEKEVKKKPTGKKTYIVKKGDSLYLIARKNNTSVANIK